MVDDALGQPPGEPGASTEQPGAKPCIVLGLLLAGRWATEVASGLGEALEHQLAARHSSVGWTVKVRSEQLVPPPRDAAEAIDAARLRMLDERWNLCVLVTDLPLEMEGRPVIGEVVSPTHGVGVISLPALGPRQMQRRLLETVEDMVGDLLGEHPREREAGGAGRRLARRRRRTRQRLAEVAAEQRDPSGARLLFAVLVGFDHARLLRSMVWANRPWRLAIGLYRAWIAALAFVVFALVTQEVWKLATELGVARLALLNALSISAMTLAIIAAHHLWERSSDRASRRQVVLFNWATLLTVALGVTALYLALLATTILGTLILIPGRAMRDALGRPEHVKDYLSVAWLIASLATIGGALGAGLESDAAIRRAIYSTHALRSG
jgi:uncharacterized membrane protein